ncbi:MAG: hypothetical protein C0506_04010 [Anaerolinea sp.]|nr:hypothetical protein [Anaerolinea sp.]
MALEGREFHRLRVYHARQRNQRRITAILASMERRLPLEYEGWQQHEPIFRRLSTPELVAEVQDGSPDRRLAALSVIDLSEVASSTIEDWIRALPDAEANELAGAIPVQRPHSSCKDDLRWVEVARLGYEKRRLPTFLVMLFSSLEALDSRHCPEAPQAWENIGDWLGDVYDRLVKDGDSEALEDISLFVFENYLDRDSIFDAFCGMVVRHEALAMQVSANPSLLLPELPREKQQLVLEEAAANGGRPFKEAWAALNGRA